SSAGRRGPRWASAPARVLGGARRDHGHRRRPPARGSRAPGVGGAPDPRRRAVRGELSGWSRRSGSRPRGGGADGQHAWPRGWVLHGAPAGRSQARPVADGRHLRHTWGQRSVRPSGTASARRVPTTLGARMIEALTPAPPTFRLTPRPYQYEAVAALLA